MVDDVPLGVTPAEAAGHIKLVMLVNDVSLRGLIPGGHTVAFPCTILYDEETRRLRPETG